MKRGARAAWRACVAAALIVAACPALSQNNGDPGEIRGLKLGLKAATMTTSGFGEFACGSVGGPARQKLDDWTGFSKCRPEPHRLHEPNAPFDAAQKYLDPPIHDH